MINKARLFISTHSENLFLAVLGLASSWDVIRILSLFKVSWDLNSLRPNSTLFYFFQGAITESVQTHYVLAAVFFLSLLLFGLTRFKRTFYALNFSTYVLFISFYLFHITYEDHRAGLITLMYSLAAIPVLLQQKKWSDNIWKALLLGVVLFYFATGVEKLLRSGLLWLNGTSLQILIFHEGQSYRAIPGAILKSVALAKVAQLAGLLVELLSPLALFKKIRPYWLVIIAGFHLNLEIFFNFKYYYVGALSLTVTLIAIAKGVDFFKLRDK